MRVDIYKRSETGGHFSYLAVPEGDLIPEEATNTDWETAERSVNLDNNIDRLSDFSIEDTLEQIAAKGYAITSIKTLGNSGDLPI